MKSSELHDNLTGLLNKEQFWETANVVRNDRITHIVWCAAILKILNITLALELKKGDEIIKMQAGAYQGFI